MREQIEITAKMYRCQKTAKRFFRDEYADKILFYKSTLRSVMAKENLDVLESVLFISKLDSVKDNGMVIMMFMAAAVELIET